MESSVTKNNCQDGSMMKKLIICCLVGFLICCSSLSFSAETSDGSILPELLLPAPENESFRDYLGLEVAAGEMFKLSDIKTDLLIIELFSMYCPYCQKEAPLVNEFYEKIKQGPVKGLTIKIIGLGASNSQFEVEHFADTYDVQFPLFADKDMSMYNALGGKGTPGFVGYKLKGAKEPVNILRNSGGFYTTEDFIQDIIANSGL